MQVGRSHPDGKHGILLPQGLTGTDAVVVRTTDALAKKELHHAGKQSSQCHEPCRDIAVDERTGCLPHHKRQCKRPYVECHTAMLHQPTMNIPYVMLQEQSHEQGCQEQWENPTQYLEESYPESQPVVRFDQREDQRHHDRTQKIGQQGIGGKCGGIATQLARNDRSSRSRGTNQTHHHALPNARTQLTHGYTEQHTRRSSARESLNQQQPQMPALGFEFLHIYSAEGEQQLGKDEPGCDERHEAMHRRFQRSQESPLGKHEVGQSTRQHGQGQGPVLDEFQHN